MTGETKTKRLADLLIHIVGPNTDAMHQLLGTRTALVPYQRSLDRRQAPDIYFRDLASRLASNPELTRELRAALLENGHEVWLEQLDSVLELDDPRELRPTVAVMLARPRDLEHLVELVGSARPVAGEPGRFEFDVQPLHGPRHRCVAVVVGESGSEREAAAERLLSLGPTLVVDLGVASSLSHEDLALGDVLVVEELERYTVAEGVDPSWLGPVRQPPTLVKAAAHLAIWRPGQYEDWQAAACKAIASSPAAQDLERARLLRPSPAVVTGRLVVGPRIEPPSRLTTALRKRRGQPGAHDVHAGLASTTEASPPTLTLRGISGLDDVHDDELSGKQEMLRELALRNALRLLLAVLRTRPLPLATHTELKEPSTPAEPAHVSWPILAAMVGLLAVWAWGLLPMTPSLPAIWTPLVLVTLFLGGIAFGVAGASPSQQGVLADFLGGVRGFLLTTKPAAWVSWAARLLDRVYGQRIFSWKAFRRSAVVSSSAFVVALVVVSLLIGDAVLSTSMRETWLMGIPLVGLGWWMLNMTSDYVSVACTRWLLRRVTRDVDGGRLAKLLVYDTLILLVLALVPTGIAGSVVAAAMATDEVVVHKVIWYDYLLGSLLGFGTDLEVIKSGVRWVVFLTFITACVPSMFIWGTFFAALLAVPRNGVLYHRAVSILGHFQNSRSSVEYGFLMLAVVVGVVGLVGGGDPEATEGASEDITVAVLEMNCERGVAVGCIVLGNLYHMGEGVEQDYARARELFERACEGGSADGCAGLGFLYYEGQGVEQDYTRARELYDRACEGGSAEGCNGLGFLYHRGQGVEQDYARARELFERACEGGSPNGCIGLGILYAEGQGVEQDYARARELYDRACEKGSANGCSRLAILYRRGEGVERDYARARELYERACEGGSAGGCTGLGFLYFEGQGVEQDNTRARELFDRACEGGSADGCIGLGILYAEGQGVEQDYARARELYERACEGGSAGGCTGLGILYAKGQGVEQDYARARELYERACEGGSTDGCTELGILYAKGQGVEQDYARARELYERACEGGSTDGCTELGILYAEGQGVEQDYARARELYERACEGGSTKACNQLTPKQERDSGSPSLD